jgi:hypothetical protein
MKLLLALAIFMVASISFGGTIDPNTPDEKYVEYGSKFKFVLKVCGKYKDGKPFCASAVAIKPRWIMTAAHVVQNCETCYVTSGEKKICVETVTYHENYHENNFGEYDIALGNTEEDLGLDFYPEFYSDDDEVGEVCSISGFGLHGTFNTGVKYSDDKRRAGSNIIESIDRKLLVCTPSRHNRTELEFIIGSGDSGGGLFIGNKLAGINSCVMAMDGKPDSTYGDESGHTRVSLYIDWINKTINGENDEK